MLKKLFAQTRLHPLYQRLKREPYYRFQSFEELQLAASWGVRLDVNTASLDDWLRLPGLSIHQARRLTKLTENQIFFHCLEDIAAALDVPAQQIKPWNAILQFCYYDSRQGLEPVPLNVNTATTVQLASVPYIDSALAYAIVSARRVGVYQDLGDLQARLKLSSEITAELLHYLSFRAD